MGHFISSGVLGGRDVGLSLDLSFGGGESVFLKLSCCFFSCTVGMCKCWTVCFFFVFGHKHLLFNRLFIVFGRFGWP